MQYVYKGALFSERKSSKEEEQVCLPGSQFSTGDRRQADDNDRKQLLKLSGGAVAADVSQFIQLCA